MRRIVELDGVRAIAILAVMGCHFYPFSTLLFQIPEFGWVGVELFFVLSGFLITNILLNLKTSSYPYQIFYIRRMLRIFPPYLAVLFLVILVTKLEHDSFPWIRVGEDAFFLQSFRNTSHALEQVGRILSGAQPPPNVFATTDLPRAISGFPIAGFGTSYGHTWSLSVEEWFYILWAPMVLKLRRRTLLYACILICATALFIRWFGFLGPDTYLLFFSRMDVLMGGAMLALWVERRKDLDLAEQKRADMSIQWATVVCGTLTLVLLFLIKPVLGREIRASLAFSVFGLPLLGFTFAGLLSQLIRQAGSERMTCRFLRSKPLTTIGTVSYMLYLVHVPIYFLVIQAAGRLGMVTGDYFVALAISTVSLGISLLTALLSFKFFEMPIMNYKDWITRRITGNGTRQIEVSQTQ